MLSSQILIDQCHGEEIGSFPENLFRKKDFFINFTSKNDFLDDFEFLKKQRLIIIGNPRPRSRSEILFHPSELEHLKRYVYQGGNILLTSSYTGDCNFPKNRGSINVLNQLTGIKKIPYCLLFHTNENYYQKSKRALIIPITSQRTHPVFSFFNPGDHIIIGEDGASYLIPYSSKGIEKEGPIDSHPLLYSPPATIKRDLISKTNQKIGSVPLLNLNRFGKGKVITSSFSQFLKEDGWGGYGEESGEKLLRGIIDFLIPKVA